MPKVEGKDFPYTEAGVEQAEGYADALGAEVEFAPGGMYEAGGRVKKYPGYFGGGMVADYMGGYSPRNIAGPTSPLSDIGNLALEEGGKVEKK